MTENIALQALKRLRQMLISLPENTSKGILVKLEIMFGNSPQMNLCKNLTQKHNSRTSH